MKLISAQTSTEAWLKGALHLKTQPKNTDYTLILEIADAMHISDEEKKIYAAVDKFLISHKAHSLHTVINTIFPVGIYIRSGPEKVLEHYAEIVPQIKAHPDNAWGTYAGRLIGKRKDQKGKEFMPLDALIQKLRKQLKTKGPMRSAYEMNLIDPLLDIPIYDSTTDRGRPRGGPCLSHLSFKLKPDRKLMLTAFYRYHYYSQRALGNLYGLAWLQEFVASSVGLERAELVCISSMATLEKEKNWSKSDMDKLLERCLKMGKYSLGTTEKPVTA
jgi:hypothetical protein